MAVAFAAGWQRHDSLHETGISYSKKAGNCKTLQGSKEQKITHKFLISMRLAQTFLHIYEVSALAQEHRNELS